MAPFVRLLTATAAFTFDGVELRHRVRPRARPPLSSPFRSEEPPRSRAHAAAAAAATAPEEIERTAGNDDPPLLFDLNSLLGESAATASNAPTLVLRTDPCNGVRGVYLYLKEEEGGDGGTTVTTVVRENDVLLSVPLSSCLRDDAPPAWLRESDDDDDDDENLGVLSVEGWVTRLTARLLDLQLDLTKDKSEAMRSWLELLPKDTDLGEILPVHWEASSLEQADFSRSLQAAVDSAYFARAVPIADLMASLTDAGYTNVTKTQVQYAMDLVQTRSCRAESSSTTDDDDDDVIKTVPPPVRVLVPAFDMINHSPDANAAFYREGESLVVRATRNIVVDGGDTQIYIDYGTSTRPAWKCLFSYGFVPSYSEDDVYESDAAELVMEDGTRFEVGPVDVPFQLIEYEAETKKPGGQQRRGASSGDDGISPPPEFTPEIGERIVNRIVEYAGVLQGGGKGGDGANDKNKKDADTAASKSLVDLRESNRRTLLACAGGLREYLKEL